MLIIELKGMSKETAAKIAWSVEKKVKGNKLNGSRL